MSTRQRADRTLLYLLDEILQGTNSVERHLAVARVLSHLVAEGAIGAVSTHDLALAQSPDLVDCCRAVHFRETLHGAGSGRQMTFDYLPPAGCGHDDQRPETAGNGGARRNRPKHKIGRAGE